MKKLLSFVLALMLALFAVSAFAEETEANVTEIQKYGNLVLSLTGSELLEAGFAYGDVVTVTINGTGYDMPIGSNFSPFQLFRRGPGQYDLPCGHQTG